jgi:signal transduction histidine kinase
MFREVKYKLAAMFTLIVVGLEFLFSFGFLLQQSVRYGINYGRLFELAVVLSVEILFISGITFVVGYFFVKELIKPAEDMFERLDQFTIDASHELKTPLSIANSSLDLAIKTHKYKQYISEAKMYIKKANNLVEKLLELARLDTYTMKRTIIPAKTIVERAIKSCDQDMKKADLQLVVTIIDDVKIRGDLVLFERCVTNLLENAIKFNKADGRIEVVLDKQFVKVSNTGKALPKEEIEKIFDRFYQSDVSRSAKGYGIGLAIVKKICDLHGWRISAESSSSLTTFTIFFRS